MTVFQSVTATAFQDGPAMLIRSEAADFDPANPDLAGFGQTIATDRPMAVYAPDGEVSQRILDWAKAQDGEAVPHASVREMIETVAADPRQWSALVIAPSEDGLFGGADCDLEIFFDLLGYLPVIIVNDD